MANSDNYPIGWVEWGDPPIRFVAILRAGGTWEVPDAPEMAETLDGLYGESYRSTEEQDGYPGFRELNAFARLAGGGKVTFLPPRYPFPPDNPEDSIVGPVLDYLKVRRPPEG